MAKKKITSQQKKTKLKKKADKVFSWYIRLRDSDTRGYCRCITCGKTIFWKEIHAGHFQSRGKMSTRWEEHNVNAQCCGCNTFKAGEQFRHGKEIDKKFGEGEAERLEKLAITIKSHTIKELEEIVRYYEEQVKELKEIKFI